MYIRKAMSNRLLIAVLTLMCFNIEILQAQNWQLFPKDSLRVYTNPSQNLGSGQDLLSGIDFRTYEQKGDTTIFDLSAFSRLDTIKGNMGGTTSDGYSYMVDGIYNGNSSFGNHAIATKEETKLIFKSKSGQSQDTIRILNTNEITTVWTAYSSNQLTIECKLLSVLKLQNDSIRNIACQIHDSNGSWLNTFIVKISKQLGLIESPVFYEVLRYPSLIKRIKEIRLSSYQEVTGKAFFKKTPGTEWQINVSRLGSSSGTFGTRKWLYENESGDTQNFTYSHVTITNGREGSSSSEQHNRDTQLIIKNSHQIFNSIPSKRVENEVVEETNNYYNECGKLVATRYMKRPYSRMIGDTLVSILTVGDRISEFNYEFTENVGLTYYQYNIYSGGSGHGTETVDYLNIPGSCEFGTPNWRFSGITPIHKPLSFYPNPASYSITIPDLTNIKSVSLMNTNGHFTKLELVNNKVDVSATPNGFYILEVITLDQFRHLEKLIIYK
ncbi:MAG: hypothetical protein ACI8SE_000570 [Bacteroidia bacterium]